MKTGRYLNEDHKEKVMAVLIAKGQRASLERTQQFIRGNIRRGTMRENSLDEINKRVQRASNDEGMARADYEAFFVANRDALIQHWMAEDLFDGRDE